MTPKNCAHHIIQLLIDLSFISQVQRRRSLKRNLVPQVNLASSFFPAIPKWKEKNQKWLLLSELYIKGQGLNYIPVFISGWKWGSINQILLSISVSSRHPVCGEDYSGCSDDLISEYQASIKQPVCQCISFMEITYWIGNISHSLSGKLRATATIKTHLFTGFNSNTTFKQDIIFVKLIFVFKAM